MGTWASYKALGRLADLIWSGQNPFCGRERELAASISLDYFHKRQTVSPFFPWLVLR